MSENNGEKYSNKNYRILSKYLTNIISIHIYCFYTNLKKINSQNQTKFYIFRHFIFSFEKHKPY